MKKENDIILSKEKFEEFQNNLENYKNLVKLDCKQKIDQINGKINILNKEIELKNNQIQNFEKKYKFLQEKYLKTLNEKQIKVQENAYKVKNKILKKPLFNKKFRISQSNDDIFDFITLNSNTISQVDMIREKYKKFYDNNFLIIENYEKERKNVENLNILPNINLSKRNNSSKEKKFKSENNSDNEVKKEYEKFN